MCCCSPAISTTRHLGWLKRFLLFSSTKTQQQQQQCWRRKEKKKATEDKLYKWMADSKMKPKMSEINFLSHLWLLAIFNGTVSQVLSDSMANVVGRRWGMMINDCALPWIRCVHAWEIYIQNRQCQVNSVLRFGRSFYEFNQFSEQTNLRYVSHLLDQQKLGKQQNNLVGDAVCHATTVNGKWRYRNLNLSREIAAVYLCHHFAKQLSLTLSCCSHL